MRMWSDAVLAHMRERDGAHVINDSKTPSGRIHVGSLRGVIVHDALLRLAQQHNIPSRFIYGVDDYDPLDSVPENADETLRAYIGKPLCHVPSPESGYSDMADYYIQEFLGVFSTLEVNAEIYRMRDVYQSGRLDQAIMQIMERVDAIRAVYAGFSKHKNDLSSWYPLQVICDNCGAIATTRCRNFDGKEVEYSCEPQQVSWVQGCGYRSKKNPFSGGAKLPWKVEWIAKWYAFGVTLEGAGKDHCTKGGSRDIADNCFRQVFEKEPPINVPYEFFLLQGAKMSSSKGIGFYAKDIVDFLPADVVRFLMLRQQPKKTVNFSVTAQYMIKLFNEYDKLVHAQQTADQTNSALFLTCRTSHTVTTPLPGFQLLMALAKMPHIDVERKVLEHTDGVCDESFVTAVKRRVMAVRFWLTHFADPSELLTLQMSLPDSVHRLSIEQRAFLYSLARALRTTKKIKSARAADIYQRLLFDVARLIPITPADAFSALYRALFDHSTGPKGGSLLAYLGASFVAQRLKNIPHSRSAFWRKTAITIDQVADFLATQTVAISKVSARILPQQFFAEESATETHVYLVQFSIFLADGLIHARRVSFGDAVREMPVTHVEQQVAAFLATMANTYNCQTEQSTKQEQHDI